MSLILFGFKGVGKTYFGKKLASITNLPFIDTDEEIIKTSDFNSISELYRFLGEKKFRAQEETVVASLSPSPLQIISLGGGTILSPKNKNHLEKIGTLIYLESPLEQLFSPHSALSSNLGCIKRLYEERLPLYRAITPAHRIDLKKYTEAEILSLLTTHLKGKQSDGL